MRRPLFGRYGRWVVLGFCSWEVVALTVGRVPTISTTVSRHKWFGVALLAALSQHWFLERVEEAIEAVADFTDGVLSAD
jgi:hypothetical protein